MDAANWSALSQSLRASLRNERRAGAAQSRGTRWRGGKATQRNKTALTPEKSIEEQLDSALGTLNSVQFPLVWLGKVEAGELVALLFKLLTRISDQRHHQQIMAKFLRFHTEFYSKQTLNLHADALGIAVTHLMQCAETMPNTMLVDILRALASTLLDNGARLSNAMHAQLVDYLVQLTSNNNSNYESRRMSINCLANMIVHGGTKIELTLYERILSVLRQGLTELLPPTTRRACKLLCNTLRALSILFPELAAAGGAGANRHKNQSVYVLSDAARLVTQVRDLICNDWSAAMRTIDAEATTTTTDSDMETLDGTGKLVWQRTGVADKLYLNALQCLQSLSRTWPSTLFPHWPILLPQSRASAQHSLFTVIDDSSRSERVRVTALNVLATLFDGAKQRLVALRMPKRSAAFVSFSEQLALMVAETHQRLLFALDNAMKSGACDAMCVATVRCMSSVASGAAYGNARVPATMLVECVELVSKWLRALLGAAADSDTSALFSALLACLAAAFASTDASVDELAAYARTDQCDSVNVLLCALETHALTAQRESEGGGGGDEEELRARRTRVTLDVLSTLGVIARGYAHAAILSRGDCWSRVRSQSLVYASLSHVDVSVRVAALRVVEECTGAFSSSAAANEEWRTLLSSPQLLAVFNDASPLCRAAACTIVANVRAHTFEALSTAQRIALVTLVLGAADDEVANVRSAASRTLGVFVLFRGLRDDSGFVSDVAEALMGAVRDTNLNVRIRACWSVANLCDALVQQESREETRDEEERAGAAHTDANGSEAAEFGHVGDVERAAVRELGVGGVMRAPNFLDELPDDLLYCVVDYTLMAARDHDKVRSNAVRALGNFARFAPVSALLSTMRVVHERRRRVVRRTHGGVDPDEDGSGACAALSVGSALPTRRAYSDEHAQWPLLREIIDVLVLNVRSGSVKVRWNACYSIASLYHNTSLPANVYAQEWFSASICPLLLDVLRRCTNFKIRINATLALATPPLRVMYAAEYARVLQYVLDTLGTDVESVSNVSKAAQAASFDEKRYAKRLEEQLVGLLLHLVPMLRAVESEKESEKESERVREYVETACSTLLRVYNGVISLDNQLYRLKSRGEENREEIKQMEKLREEYVIGLRHLSRFFRQDSKNEKFVEVLNTLATMDVKEE